VDLPPKANFYGDYFSEEETVEVVPVDTELNWNTRYQEVIEKEDSQHKYKELSILAKDFVYAARVYGNIIISEIYVPNNQKTIKPINMGGIAGGSKYICQGILFKFAMDVALGNQWLYGGIEMNNEKAQKAAGHEMKGLLCYNACGFKEFHFPLLTLIHYRGFCLTAMTKLPLMEIVYGSNDAGKNCHNDDPVVSTLMEKAGQILGLCSHTVLNASITGPADLEVHKGKDKRLYLIDFARVMPPESPLKTNIHNSIWYSLLRPTFVMNWKTHQNSAGLCSDAFTRWCSKDTNEKSLSEEVHQATEYLYTQIIPNTANNLVKLYRSNPTEFNLVTKLHEYEF